MLPSSRDTLDQLPCKLIAMQLILAGRVTAQTCNLPAHRTSCTPGMYSMLPPESRQGRVQLLVPDQDMPQATKEAHDKPQAAQAGCNPHGGGSLGCTIHLAATGDHGFRRRLRLGFPLLKHVSCCFLPLLLHVNCMPPSYPSLCVKCMLLPLLVCVIHMPLSSAGLGDKLLCFLTPDKRGTVCYPCPHKKLGASFPLPGIFDLHIGLLLPTAHACELCTSILLLKRVSCVPPPCLPLSRRVLCSMLCDSGHCSLERSMGFRTGFCMQLSPQQGLNVGFSCP